MKHFRAEHRVAVCDFRGFGGELNGVKDKKKITMEPSNCNIRTYDYHMTTIGS